LAALVQDEVIDMTEMRQHNGKLTGFTHARMRQQMEVSIGL